MPRIVVSLTDGQKDVWVAAAHDERVTLSEWVRRAADARAGLGTGEVVMPVPPPVVRAPVSPVPSPVDAVSPDSFQGVRVGKSSFRPDPKKKT